LAHEQRNLAGFQVQRGLATGMKRWVFSSFYGSL
jgi:hypothetical protein